MFKSNNVLKLQDEYQKLYILNLIQTLNTMFQNYFIIDNKNIKIFEEIIKLLIFELGNLIEFVSIIKISFNIANVLKNLKKCTENN